MSTDTTYNGWRNIETWRVQLHLANDETESRVVGAIAFLYVTRFPRWPQVRRDHYPDTLAEWLREYVAERAGVETVGGTAFEMFARDVVEAALARVDWEQVADHWLEVGRVDARERGVAVGNEQEGRA